MANVDLIRRAETSRKRSIRTEPTQRRSTQRLDALLDAAAEIVDETGFDRLTTQMVAERAGASIGTVYRYFPDRVAVLHALRERAIRRFRERVADDMEQAELETWRDVVDVAVRDRRPVRRVGHRSPAPQRCSIRPSRQTPTATVQVSMNSPSTK